MSDQQRATIEVRRAFGRRLRVARLALGYTQEQMGYALGIQPARYGKYEIGRSEAPFDVLIRIAELTKVDLDYLIAGRSGRRAKVAFEQLMSVVEILPTAAVVFDKHARLLTYNELYRYQFFADQPRLLKRGTPQEVMVRGWAYAQGLTEADVEAVVRARLPLPSAHRSVSELHIGSRGFHFAETIDDERRLVLITDLGRRPAPQ
jgi:transcriptional regulator with XRE-family HTH domain